LFGIVRGLWDEVGFSVGVLAIGGRYEPGLKVNGTSLRDTFRVALDGIEVALTNTSRTLSHSFYCSIICLCIYASSAPA